MNTKNLSTDAFWQLGQIIYTGLSNAIEHDTIDKKQLKELLDWYKINIVLSYNSLEEEFNKVR